MPSALSRRVTRPLTAALVALCLGTSLACGGITDAFTADPVPVEYEAFVGVWEGIGVDLVITADGGMDYDRTSGSVNTSIQAPIQSWSPDGFDVGVGPLTTRFEVQQVPQLVDGQWQMTVDGVTLHRTL